MDKAQVLEKFPITQDSTVYDVPAKPGDLYKIRHNPVNLEVEGASLIAGVTGSVTSLFVTAREVLVGAGLGAIAGGAAGVAGAGLAGALVSSYTAHDVKREATAHDVVSGVTSLKEVGLKHKSEQESLKKGFRNYALSQFPNIAYAFNNPDETALIFGALTGLAGAAIEPIQIYKKEFDKRFDLFQGHVKDQVIPNTSPLLYNAVEQNPLDASPKEILGDLNTILTRAFPNKSAWGFSRHSTAENQQKYKEQIEKVMDLSQPFRNEYKIEI